MSWSDRIQESAFTSPSGVRHVFKTENVSVEINKRDSISEFPEYDGGLVQNFGIGAVSYPLPCIFWGENHDREADEFLKSLSEPGKGILEHIFYGRLENIVAFGPISRRDDLKTAANQTIFQVNFVQSSEFQFPVSVLAVSDEIEFNLEQFYAEQAAAYAAGIKLASARERLSLIDSLKAKLNDVKRFIAGIAATVQEIESEFKNAIALVEDSLNTLINTPLQLAGQIIDIIKLPARAASRISATLEAYQGLLSATISDANGLYTASINNTVNNRFFNSDLFSAAAFGSMLSAAREVAEATREISGQSLEDFVSQTPEEIPAFISKSSIIDTINLLDSEFAGLISWNEANRDALDLLDTGEAYSYLRRAANGVAGFLIQISFSTRQERELIVGNQTHFVPLCSELYGTLDAAFDFFILTNDLTSDEILEIPKERKIIYYA